MKINLEWPRRTITGNPACDGCKWDGIGTPLRRKLDGPEIGFWVDGACQGQGIASRSSRALVDLVASDGRYDAVYLAHDRTNLASRRVPEKLGFDLLHEVPVTDPEKIAPADAGFSVRWRMAIDWWRAGAGVGPG